MPRLVKIFTAVTVLTLGLFGSLVWYMWGTFQYLETTQKNYIRLTELSGSIVHLDEVLTMSARMAAATGDLKWEARYRSFEPNLDATIKEAMLLGQGFSLKDAAAKTDTANLKLVDMENQAFDLVRKDQTEKAATILSSAEYEAQKKIYLSGITQITETIRGNLENNVTEYHQRGYLAVSSILIVTPCLAFGWILLARLVQQYNTNRKQAEEAIQALNEELEQRVLDRTKQLEASNLGLKQLAQQLENAYRELKSAQSCLLQQEKMASIGQLAAGVAHEINNPIGFIISNLNSLQKYSDKIVDFVKTLSDATEKMAHNYQDQSRELLETIVKQKKSAKLDYIIEDLGNLINESLDGADRIKKIVQNLKSFSRLDETAFQMADINAGLESTINIVWNELKYKATLKKEYGDIPRTMCNPGQLNQVFMNILINAAQAIQTQGEIAIRTATDSNMIYISISDTGGGIPAEKLDRIFEPFFTTKEVGKGTGLGLSIAYDIIRKHNGEIQVESVVGKGTTFTVSIPIVIKQQPGEAEERNGTIDERSRTRTEVG